MLTADFWRIIWERLPEWIPFLMPGVFMTIQLTAVNVVGAIAVGTVAAIGRISRRRLMRATAAVYIETFRGVPGLVSIYVFYFSLPAIGLDLPPFAAATAALILTGGAYAAEVIRGGIAGVGRSQQEAGLALGFNPLSTWRFVLLPQVFRIALPGLAALAILQLQYSSLASVIAVPELTNLSFEIAILSFLFMHVFLVAGVFYLVLAWCLMLGYRALELRLGRGFMHA